MKRNWEMDELLEHWTLTLSDRELAQTTKTEAGPLGFALLLKWFQYEGRFPSHRIEVPSVLLVYLAQQLAIPVERFSTYEWNGRTMERHRAQIREFLGFREATVADAQGLTAWLLEHVLPHTREEEALKVAFYERCRALRIEPPTVGRIERLVRSALNTQEERFCQAVHQKLSPSVCKRLDELLVVATSSPEETIADTEGTGYSTLHHLKSDVGAVGLDSVLQIVSRLQQLQGLELPPDLFARVPLKTLDTYRQRVATEDAHEMRRHPDPIRHTLLAAFCHLRAQDLTDMLADLLCEIIHRIETRAEKKVDNALLQSLKRVRGKPRLLFLVAEAATTNPDGTVRQVVFPVASEQTLLDLVQEGKATGAYDQQVQTTMRKSYCHHYRRMLPPLLKVLSFASNNTQYRPVIAGVGTPQEVCRQRTALL